MVFHTISPLSGFSAHTTPFFWPAITNCEPSALVANMRPAPKSQSLLILDAGGQLGPSGVFMQPVRKMSFGVVWYFHASEPSSMRMARMASLVSVAGAEVFSPVPT